MRSKTFGVCEDRAFHGRSARPGSGWAKAATVRSLGFGGDQDVGEQEEVPVLRLHPRLELDVRVEEERPVRVDEEGLDQRARVRAHGRQEALSGTREGKNFQR